MSNHLVFLSYTIRRCPCRIMLTNHLRRNKRVLPKQIGLTENEKPITAVTNNEPELDLCSNPQLDEDHDNNVKEEVPIEETEAPTDQETTKQDMQVQPLKQDHEEITAPQAIYKEARSVKQKRETILQRMNARLKAVEKVLLQADLDARLEALEKEFPPADINARLETLEKVWSQADLNTRLEIVEARLQELEESLKQKLTLKDERRPDFIWL